MGTCTKIVMENPAKTATVATMRAPYAMVPHCSRERIDQRNRAASAIDANAGSTRRYCAWMICWNWTKLDTLILARATAGPNQSPNNSPDIRPEHKIATTETIVFIRPRSVTTVRTSTLRRPSEMRRYVLAGASVEVIASHVVLGMHDHARSRSRRHARYPAATSSYERQNAGHHTGTPGLAIS
jgi:hypothetical protein